MPGCTKVDQNSEMSHYVPSDIRLIHVNVAFVLKIHIYMRPSSGRTINKQFPAALFPVPFITTAYCISKSIHDNKLLFQLGQIAFKFTCQETRNCYCFSLYENPFKSTFLEFFFNPLCQCLSGETPKHPRTVRPRMSLSE